jgi:multidrug efflux pump
VIPLAISNGAGSASRHSVATGVIGGMISATFLALLFVPLFFRLVTRERTRSGPGVVRAPTGAQAEQPARVAGT